MWWCSLGTGDLYWTGGMIMADEAAMAARPDHLLWLNDDVELAAGALTMLIDAAQKTKSEAIIVGTTVDSDSNAATYGGYRRSGRPLDLELVEPNGQLQPVSTMNGNVVLIPRAVRERVGTLDSRFQHNMSDMDYGFRAFQAGLEIVVAPEAIGRCKKNEVKGKWRDPRVPLHERVPSRELVQRAAAHPMAALHDPAHRLVVAPLFRWPIPARYVRNPEYTMTCLLESRRQQDPVA